MAEGKTTFGSTIADPRHRLTCGTAVVKLDPNNARVRGLACKVKYEITLGSDLDADPDHGQGRHSLLMKSRDRLNLRRDQVFYIHGFDTSFADAAWYGAQLQYQLNRFLNLRRDALAGAGLRVPDAFDVIIYSWPANRGKTLRKVQAAFGYVPDLIASANSAAATARLLSLLEELTVGTEFPSSGRVHLMCQSMGVRALNHGFRQYRDSRGGGQLPQLADSILFSGSDVGSHAFERMRHLKRLPEVCRQITVYHNRKDTLGGLSSALRLMWGRGESNRMSKTGLLNPEKAPMVDAVNVEQAVDAQAARGDGKQDPYGHYYGRLNPAVLSDAVAVMAGADWSTTPDTLPHRQQKSPANVFELTL